MKMKHLFITFTRFAKKEWTYGTQCVQNAGADFEMREGMIWERGQPFLRERERERER